MTLLTHHTHSPSLADDGAAVDGNILVWALKIEELLARGHCFGSQFRCVTDLALAPLCEVTVDPPVPRIIPVVLIVLSVAVVGIILVVLVVVGRRHDAPE